MNAVLSYGWCAAGLVGLGLFGAIVAPDTLRRILGMSVLGAGVFLLFGAIARHGAGPDGAADPVPQALIITGIVVAFSGTALAALLLERLARVPEDSGEDE